MAFHCQRPLQYCWFSFTLSFSDVLRYPKHARKDLPALRNSKSKDKYDKDDKHPSEANGNEGSQRQAAMECSRASLKRKKDFKLKRTLVSVATSALLVSPWLTKFSDLGRLFSQFITGLGSLCSVLAFGVRTCLPASPPSAQMIFPDGQFYKGGKGKKPRNIFCPRLIRNLPPKHGLKPQNSPCTTTGFSTGFYCLHGAILHIEAKINLVSLGLLDFKPIKCPKIAPVLVVSLLSPAKPCLFSFLVNHFTLGRCLQDLARTSRRASQGIWPYLPFTKLKGTGVAANEGPAKRRLPLYLHVHYIYAYLCMTTTKAAALFSDSLEKAHAKGCRSIFKLTLLQLHYWLLEQEFPITTPWWPLPPLSNCGGWQQTTDLLAMANHGHQRLAGIKSKLGYTSSKVKPWF